MAARGDYDLLVSAPDVWPRLANDARFAVRFANADTGSQARTAASAQFRTGATVRIH